MNQLHFADGTILLLDSGEVLMDLNSMPHHDATVYLIAHYGERYDIHAPKAPGGQWVAIARFGSHDQLCEWSANALEDELLDHTASHGEIQL